MDLLRVKGAVKFNGQIPGTQLTCEVLLGPLVVEKSKEEPKPDGDSRKTKREHYEMLLNHPVTDQVLDMLP